ncbi:MAG: carbohydrate porin [Hydrogenophilales bacterium]|nr:carbohydrate porin [Hydrogenophilales bacterium]
MTPRKRLESYLRGSASALLPLMLALAALACAAPLLATAAVESQRAQADASPDATPEQWAVYGQFTNLTQWHPAFTAPYSGSNSMDPHARNAETTDVTLFAGARLWQGAELWLNPELDQGFGLSDTLGIAGFPSGEAYKVGANKPYLRLPRAFVRQVINIGGSEETAEAAANQFTGTRAANNLILTLGKFSVVDIFDTNAYAHDPRSDFFNWAVVDAGAFDYAADSWGFTDGVAAEWTQSWWTLRGGVFALSTEPNGTVPDTHFRQHSVVGEFEIRHQWLGHPGKVKLLGFMNRGRMGSYRDALSLAQQTGTQPDAGAVRRFQNRPGIAINVEQEIAPDLGFFARASTNDGSKEAFEFTEINRSVSAGLSLRGDRWGRHDDTVGFAAVVNGLSGAARDYFAAGGMGILIGDGRLNYRLEKIVEAYYSLKVVKQIALTADVQYVANPAYNRDRGPIPIFGLRVHAEF